MLKPFDLSFSTLCCWKQPTVTLWHSGSFLFLIIVKPTFFVVWPKWKFIQMKSNGQSRAIGTCDALFLHFSLSVPAIVFNNATWNSQNKSNSKEMIWWHLVAAHCGQTTTSNSFQNVSNKSKYILPQESELLDSKTYSV